jgi:hypothetical protein
MNSHLKTVVSVDELLSPWHKEILSTNAQKLYCAVWSVMKDRNTQSTWMDDAQASRRSRVLIQHIPGAQSELVRSGLMHLEPGENQTKYEFVADGAEPQ